MLCENYICKCTDVALQLDLVSSVCHDPCIMFSINKSHVHAYAFYSCMHLQITTHLFENRILTVVVATKSMRHNLLQSVDATQGLKAY